MDAPKGFLLDHLDGQGFRGSSHFGVWGVVLAGGRGLPDD